MYRIETERQAAVSALDLERCLTFGSAFCFARSGPPPLAAWVGLLLVPLTLGAQLDHILPVGLPLALLATPVRYMYPALFVASVLLAVWSGCVAQEYEEGAAAPEWLRMSAWVVAAVAAAGRALTLRPKKGNSQEAQQA